MANGWSKEMQAALQADAEKLSAESGEEHKIVFSDYFDPLSISDVELLAMSDVEFDAWLADAEREAFPAKR